MRVLYTCVRPFKAKFRSPKYPSTTFDLRNYFFPFSSSDDPVCELETKLVRMYEYAMAHWESVGNEWFALFDDQRDSKIRDRLKEHAGKPVTPPDGRIVVLAIDEARYVKNGSDGGQLRQLQRALRRATHRIRESFGKFSCLFVVLIDSDPSIVNISSTGDSTDGDQFPPFVLTQTMDIRFRAILSEAVSRGQTCTQFYQELMSRDHDAMWPTFASMGRPLWDRVRLHACNGRASAQEVLHLAAAMLLGGSNADDQESFTQDSEFGAASVLCRLGLRPTMQGSLAPRVVADFLGTLTHSSDARGHLVTTYSSEPVLSFAAARVWYRAAPRQHPHSTLTVCILRQFLKLVESDLVDMGDDAVSVVGRFMTLLAMDTTRVAVAAHVVCKSPGYAGELYSVESLLDVLYGNQPFVVRDSNCKEVTAEFGDQVEGRLAMWSSWKVGFGYFVEMTNVPSMDELWAMLARRAAGVFPRDFGDADLFIPIFNGTDVSMILVRVVNHERDETLDAKTMMQPSRMFTSDLKQLREADVCT